MEHSTIIILVWNLFLLLLFLPNTIHTYDRLCPSPCVCRGPVVNCSSRNLNFVPENLPIWTEVLLMANNPLESLVAFQDRLIISPNRLRQIDFSNTNLRKVKHDFLQRLFNDVSVIEDSLETLIFDNNQLSSFPLIENLSQLKVLSLVGNKLDYDSIFQVELDVFEQLEELDLSNNQISTIPRHFLSSKVYPTLMTLNLHNTQIDKIEAGAFDLFINLRTLKLSKNNLAFVTNEWIGHLSMLRELDLNSNRIEQIGTIAFNGSKSLEILKMRRNRLSDLPDGSFWGLSNLQKLNLDHNNINNIRLGWTYGLTSLTELALRHNNIVDIQAGAWNPTPNLQDLYLNHNQLTRIDHDTFNRLSHLKSLKLSNNRISFIEEGAFHSMTTLDILDLSDNLLSWAIESSNGFFTALRSLKKLRLDNNQIRLILKHTFNGLTELTQLSLSGNPISSIQSGSFSWFKNLNELNLEETDLLCDCTMKWLFKWLKSSDVHRKFASNMHCKHPNHLKRATEHSFLHADIDEFQCQHLLKPYMIDDFQSIDKPISAIKGKNMTFYCKVATSSLDKVQFKWIKDNEVMDQKYPRVKYETLTTPYSDNATLYTNVFTLINVEDEDQGNYQCMASNSYDSVYSHKFKVNVHVLPYFIKKPQNVTVKVGNTARLECAAGGQPIPNISWQKEAGNFPAATERRVRFYPKDDVYFIVDISHKDNGTYTCNASNDAGTVITTVHLNVIEPPSFVRKMVDKESQAGSTVSLQCMAAGSPMPKVTWFKDGVLLEQTERHFFTAEGQVLIIVKLKTSDEGRYSCNITNGYGTEQDSVHLKVFSSISVQHSMPANVVKASLGGDTWTMLLGFIRSNASIILIIITCVLFNSIIWIGVICINRRRQLAKMNDNDVEDHFEPDYDEDEECFDNNLSTNLEQIRTTTPLYPNRTKFEYQSDNESESSSARDSGIEGRSCPSTGYDNDQDYFSHAADNVLSNYSHGRVWQPVNLNIRNANVQPRPMSIMLPNESMTFIRNPQLVEQQTRTLDKREQKSYAKKMRDHRISLQKQMGNSQLKTFNLSYSSNDIQKI